ncbi:ribosomal protein S9 [Chloroherpeton thalassium ATCC 35110]|uniref:Small ribosomal subunit protein uS9 n=1 Tax=Chloroherpeton thalassium (strain ATCC 35110 / GB-78) TaxID=517418 RepID=B3QV47_CHLT3|nr:30S ribosomal protein S9 [Chloroherpeton thalassium]ACF13001.1 ribosomal protein S9 [Chloroherpeton thalassium ATCC 35110]
MNDEMISATGRRKTSVARAFVRPGTGRVLVNGKDVKEYFAEKRYSDNAVRPLMLTDSLEKFDVKVSVYGGGLSGQVGAVSLAIARAIVEYDEANRVALRPERLLTRDPRMVERKKYGQKKARKRFQFSKR